MSLNNQVLNLDARQILLKRGNAIVSQGYVGPIGEITLDTTLNTLRIHDGVTPGGTIIPTAANVAAEVTDAVNVIGGTTISGQIATALLPVYANIALVNANVSSLIGNGPTTLNTLAELAAAVDNDPDFGAKVLLALTQVRANVTNEVNRAINAEQVLQTAINNEVSARTAANAVLVSLIGTQSNAYIAADSVLQNNINTESGLRVAAFNQLQTDISNEATARSSADTALQGNIIAEATARASADTTLQTNINNEATTRSSADAALQANIDSLNNSLSTVAKTGLYSDLSGKPTLLSQFTNDTNFANVSYVDTQISNIINGAPSTLDTLKEIGDAFQSADGNLLAAINSLTSSSSSTVDAEEAARIAADTALQANIDAETTARISADTTLQTNINNEATARLNADAALQGNIDAEATARIAVDTALQGNISAEVTARTVADTALQGNIDAEATARTSADTTLQTNINNEATTRANADIELQGNIIAEETARIAADLSLQGNITAETTARIAADSALQANITAEETARIAADTALQGNITAEISARVSADTALQGNITAEETARIAADTALQGNITAEATARSSADTTLQTNINNEATARANADTALQGNIDAEATARIAADSALQANIEAEATARQSLQSNLQSQINNIISNVDPGALDSLTEIVTAFQGSDGNIITALNTLSSGTGSNIAAEANARIASDLSLQSNIETLTNSLANVAFTGNYSDLSNVPPALNTGDVQFLDDEIYTQTGRMSFYTEGAVFPEINRIDFSTDQFGIDVTGEIQLYAGTNLRVVTNNAVNGRTWEFKDTGSLELPGIEDDTTPVLDFFGGPSGSLGNHIVTLASDWTLKVKARADAANEGHLWLEAGQNTKIEINGSTSNINLIASDGVSTSTWTFDSNGDLTAAGNVISGNGRINFVANSSGDGYGYTTMELRPDTSISSDQYIIIDPTAPSHIHIRAGGTQDQSGAQLFLGGEKNHFTVTDGGLTRMQTEQLMSTATYSFNTTLGFSSAVWSSDGLNHTILITDPTVDVYTAVWALTGESLIELYDGNNYYTVTYSGYGTPGHPAPVTLTVNEAPPSSPINLNSIYIDIRQTRQSYVEVNGTDIRMEAMDDIRIYSNDVFRLYNNSTVDPIEIIVNADVGPEKRWTFNVGGTITFPDDTNQSTAWLGSIDRIESGLANVTVANTGVVSLPAVSNSQVTISGATKTVKGNPYSVRSAYSSEYEIWKASSEDVVAAKVTVRLHNDYYTYTELFDVMLVKEATNNANVSFSVGPRIKSNDSYPDGVVDVRLSDGNKLTLYYASVQGDASFYTFDAVEFTKTV